MTFNNFLKQPVEPWFPFHKQGCICLYNPRAASLAQLWSEGTPFECFGSPEGGAVGEDCGTRRRWGLSGGRKSLGMDPETCSWFHFLFAVTPAPKLPCLLPCLLQQGERYCSGTLHQNNPLCTRFCQGVFLQQQKSNLDTATVLGKLCQS